jgi:hypothetical protein
VDNGLLFHIITAAPTELTIPDYTINHPTLIQKLLKISTSMQLWSNEPEQGVQCFDEIREIREKKVYCSGSIRPNGRESKTSSQESINSSERFAFLKKCLSMAPYTEESFEARMLSIFYSEKKIRRLPTLPPTGSTIGARVLNFRVRDGNGCAHPAVVTGLYSNTWSDSLSIACWKIQKKRPGSYLLSHLLAVPSA